MIQIDCAGWAPNSRAIAGSATFATDESSTAIVMPIPIAIIDQ